MASLHSLPFALLDVFAATPLSGNGLALFLLEQEISCSAMQSITQEMRQFETIFLRPGLDRGSFHARIFTMEEELPFAGHPVLGAAAFWHARYFADQAQVSLQLKLDGRSMALVSRLQDGEYFAEMDQGPVHIDQALAPGLEAGLLAALNLTPADQAPGLPLQVISTGLPYLIVPVRANLDRSRIMVPDFAALLESVGAKFVYVLDMVACEGRTWDNDGRVEDIATGSAAGPAAAYLVLHQLAQVGQVIVLQQGRFLGRPSQLQACVSMDGAAMQVRVSGQVCMVGEGVLRVPARLLAAD